MRGTADWLQRKTKQIPKTWQHQLGPIGTQPWSLKPPRWWDCCLLSMELCWWVLVCGAVLGVAGEWGWDVLAAPLSPPTASTGGGGWWHPCPGAGGW